MTGLVPAAAAIRRRGDRRFWLCPNCGQTLGEVTPTRLVILIAGHRVLSFRLQPDMEQVCHRCHATSVLDAPPA